MQTVEKEKVEKLNVNVFSSSWESIFCLVMVVREKGRSKSTALINPQNYLRRAQCLAAHGKKHGLPRNRTSVKQCSMCVKNTGFCADQYILFLQFMYTPK
jgi:hypothetical protein